MYYDSYISFIKICNFPSLSGYQSPESTRRSRCCYQPLWIFRGCIPNEYRGPGLTFTISEETGRITSRAIPRIILKNSVFLSSFSFLFLFTIQGHQSLPPQKFIFFQNASQLSMIPCNGEFRVSGSEGVRVRLLPWSGGQSGSDEMGRMVAGDGFRRTEFISSSCWVPIFCRE